MKHPRPVLASHVRLTYKLKVVNIMHNTFLITLKLKLILIKAEQSLNSDLTACKRKLTVYLSILVLLTHVLPDNTVY